MAISLGFSSDSKGDLYELFSDGTKKLIEAGYQKRIDSTVASLNSSTNIATTTVTATPSAPSIASTVTTKSATSVKTASPDIILFNDDAVPIETMADLIFEDIGGQELINIARTDTINGQSIVYQPIKNIAQINQQYNPNNIIGIQKTQDKFFSNFSIKLADKIPNVGSGPNGEPVYLNSLGNIIVEAVNLDIDEQIEVQISLDGTIYEAEL